MAERVFFSRVIIFVFVLNDLEVPIDVNVVKVARLVFQFISDLKSAQK